MLNCYRSLGRLPSGQRYELCWLGLDLSSSRLVGFLCPHILRVGIGVGAAVVILLGSKQLRDNLSEILNDGLEELKRQTQKTVNTARQRLQEAIDIGADAYNQAQKS
jgi:hypothetical protein